MSPQQKNRSRKLVPESSTIHYDLCALLFCTVDVSDHFLLMLASDQRAEVVALVLIGADLETGHCFAHFADQGIGCCITYCV